MKYVTGTGIDGRAFSIGVGSGKIKTGTATGGGPCGVRTPSKAHLSLGPGRSYKLHASTVVIVSWLPGHEVTDRATLQWLQERTDRAIFTSVS